MESANGIYNAVFTGQLGKLVFTNESKIWWVFYSSEKKGWVIASDGTPDGAKELAIGSKLDYKSFTWITGTSDVESNIPKYFSTGYLQSIPSANLPDRNSDYFANVEFISAYDRFIEVDAYLQGWLNCEIIGEYTGYIFREITGSIQDDVKNKNNTYRFYSGTKYYVYFNGNFKGKLQNGWLGSDKINPINVEDMLKVVGEFVSGNIYDSCDNPFFISGNINSHVSSTNRDRLVLNFDKYDSNRFDILEKKFKSVNLVRLPRKIENNFRLNPNFIGEYKILPRGFQSVPNYERGRYESINKFKTINKYIQPVIWNYKIELDVNVKSTSIIECVPILYKRNLKLNKSSKEIYLGSEQVQLINKKEDDKFVPDYIEILSSKFNLLKNIVYNQDLTINSREISKFIYEKINDSSYVKDLKKISKHLMIDLMDEDFNTKENTELLLRKSNINFCLIIKK